MSRCLEPGQQPDEVVVAGRRQPDSEPDEPERRSGRAVAVVVPEAVEQRVDERSGVAEPLFFRRVRRTGRPEAAGSDGPCSDRARGGDPARQVGTRDDAGGEGQRGRPGRGAGRVDSDACRRDGPPACRGLERHPGPHTERGEVRRAAHEDSCGNAPDGFDRDHQRARRPVEVDVDGGAVDAANAAEECQATRLEIRGKARGSQIRGSVQQGHRSVTGRNAAIVWTLRWRSH